MKFFRRSLLALGLSLLLVPALAAQAPELQAKVDEIFSPLARPDSPGCALGVIRDGAFVYQRGYGMGNLELGVPLSPQSVFYMGSVSKQFTAASVVLAAEQGLLSLDDDVRKWIPELPSYGPTITLRHMLHHTSGLRDVLTLLALSGGHAEDVHPVPEFIALIARQQALNFQPGDEYLYSNSNYVLLAEIVHRASGKPFSQFAEENIFKPLGMTHTRFYDDHTVVLPGRVAAYGPRRGGGFRVNWSTNFDKVGDGGLMSSVDDLLLWDRNFYDNRLGKGTLLKELHTRGVLNSGKPIDYALGLVIGQYRGLPIVEHGGALFGYRTEILRFPEQKFSVLCLCNLASENPGTRARRVADLYLEGRFPAPAGPAGPSKPLSIPFDARPLAGTYRNPQDRSVAEIAARDGGLSFRGALIKPFAPGLFADANGAQYRFEPLSDGMRMTLALDDGATRTFERIERAKPSAAALAQYAGEYFSAELQATYRFAVTDGKLTVTNSWDDANPLEPAVRDEFGAGGLVIAFRRDAAGRVSGFDLFAGRVRKIGFARRAPAAAAGQ